MALAVGRSKLRACGVCDHRSKGRAYQLHKARPNTLIGSARPPFRGGCGVRNQGWTGLLSKSVREEVTNGEPNQLLPQKLHPSPTR